MSKTASVAILMGSKSDLDLMKPAAATLCELGVPCEVRVMSAHRTPERTAAFVKGARDEGVRVFICAAGGAAHLAGAVAAHTTMPVIGVPLARTPLAGVDALYATVQMPQGMPVATVAVDGAANARAARRADARGRRRGAGAAAGRASRSAHRQGDRGRRVARRRARAGVATAMQPPADELARAIAALRRGQVVCVPTETTYGLAADARSAEAVARVVALKGRDPSRSPIALIAADAAQARAVTGAWPARAEALAAAHWPGPLTLVLPAARALPAALVGSAGVGVRVASHAWARALAAGLGGAITATSANPHGAAAATTVAEARGYFGPGVSVYLDAGTCAATLASTVVAVDADGALRVLRHGAIAIADA